MTELLTVWTDCSIITINVIISVHACIHYKITPIVLTYHFVVCNVHVLIPTGQDLESSI